MLFLLRQAYVAPNSIFTITGKATKVQKKTMYGETIKYGVNCFLAILIVTYTNLI